MRSHTRIIMFTHNTQIIWFSRRQNTVKVAAFGSELVAVMIHKDLIVVLRYKLNMFCFILEVPAYVFWDNSGVVKNMSIAQPVLNKKHNAINQHSVCEAVAADILQIGKEDGETNLAVLKTEVMNGHKKWDLCYHVFC